MICLQVRWASIGSTVAVAVCGFGVFLKPAPSVADGTAAAEEAMVIAKLREIGGLGVRIRTTEHFVIAYDTHWPNLESVVERTEAVFSAAHRFATAVGLAPTDPPGRLAVMLFGDERRFPAYAKKCGLLGPGLSGFYDPTENVAAFLDPLQTPKLRLIGERLAEEESKLAADSSGSEATAASRSRRLKREKKIDAWKEQFNALLDGHSRLVIQHEIAHLVLFNLGVHSRTGKDPRWLVEGLACQFEFASDEAVGESIWQNPLRRADLLSAVGVVNGTDRMTTSRIESLTESSKLISLADMVGDPSVFERHRTEAAAIYAQAWAIVSYLQGTRPKQFAEYLCTIARRSVNERVDRDRELADFEANFGPPDVGLHREVIHSHLSRAFTPQQPPTDPADQRRNAP